jgi:hypothetical protein
MKKGGDDDDDKDEKPVRRDEFVETPPSPRPEPVWEEPVVERTEELPLVDTGYTDASDTSLEERVEALEAKADEEKPFQRGDL